MNPRISAVVPIFNSELFLRDSEGMLGSLLRQTLRDIEIILVDDGSSDDSLSICKKYASQDDRIRVIAQANGGESAARNTGIQAARGQYVAIVDHDDQLDSRAFEVLNRYADTFNPDIVRCNFVTVTERGQTAQRADHKYGVLFDRTYIRDNILPSMIGVADVGKALPGHWTYVHKREMLMRESVFYDETKRKEDDHRFIVDALNASNSIVLVEDCLYRFIKRRGSNTSNYTPRFDNIMDNLAHYEELFAGEYDFRSPRKVAYNISFVEESVFYVLIHEKDVPDKRKEVLRILTHEKVVGWYRQLSDSRPFSRLIRACVVSGNFDLAYLCFEVVFTKSRLKRRFKQLRSILP